MEFTREPDPQLGFVAWGWLTMGQLLSLGLVAAGVAVAFTRWIRPQHGRLLKFTEQILSADLRSASSLLDLAPTEFERRNFRDNNRFRALEQPRGPVQGFHTFQGWDGFPPILCQICHS